MGKLAKNGGSPVRTDPFPVWPIWGDEEIDNLKDVVKNGKWGCLHGTVTANFEKKFAAFQQAKHGICVNSGTTALRLALTASDIPAGSEVLLPAYTFIATATAVVDMGGVPIFVDIDPESYNIDVDKAEQAITGKTVAILPVHFAGRPADMDSVTALAKKYNLKIVEDAAQAWGSEWRGKRVGALGDAGCFSFQSSKNINAGEGGIILTNDDLVAKMARSHTNCGRSDDGEWYEHFFFGGNYRMTEFQSAVLLAQLDRYGDQLQIRSENLKYLDEQVRGIDGVEPLKADPRITAHSSHLYIFRYKKEAFGNAAKADFIDALRKEGIPTSPGYSIPLYEQPVFKNLAFGPRGRSVDFPVTYTGVSCPESEKACYEEAVWFTQNMLLGTRQDMDDIIEALTKIRKNAEELAKTL